MERMEKLGAGRTPAGLQPRLRTYGRRVYQARMAYLFLLPAYLLMLVFLAYPLVRSLLLSMYEWNGINRPEFVGLENFRRIITEDDTFYQALKNNVIFSVLTTGGTVILGFLLALSIERRVRGWNLFKVIYFLPVMMSSTVVGLLWGRLFDPTYGPINALARSLGWANPPVWLGSPGVALYAIIVVTIWQYAGFPMIMFLSAIENIPLDINDAATLDGVTWWQRALRVTLPLVMHVVLVMVMVQLIFSFKVFDIIWAMTSGGPGGATTVLGIYLYRSAFEFTEFGYGSAVAVLMFIIIFVMSTVYLRLFRPDQIEY